MMVKDCKMFSSDVAIWTKASGAVIQSRDTTRTDEPHVKITPRMARNLTITNTIHI